MNTQINNRSIYHLFAILFYSVAHHASYTVPSFAEVQTTEILVLVVFELEFKKSTEYYHLAIVYTIKARHYSILFAI
jgi:hypothetical protein